MAGGDGAGARRAPAGRLALPSVPRPAPAERAVAAVRRDRTPMTLTAFLLARIAEDEAAADAAPAGGGPAYLADPTDPARVLAECRAKRRVVVLADEATGLDETVDMEREAGSRGESGIHYVGDRILRAMAAVYDGHRDFDPAWRD